MHQPGCRIPQVISATMIIGMVTTYPLFLALLFTITDLEAITSSRLPSLEMILQA
jgi:choline transport protein